MNMLTEFKLIGRVGEIREVGSTLRVSVASSFSRRDNSGEWIDRTRWNGLWCELLGHGIVVGKSVERQSADENGRTLQGPGL
jgi:hypothetical protein